jgi:hypothetical protein
VKGEPNRWTRISSELAYDTPILGDIRTTASTNKNPCATGVSALFAEYPPSKSALQADSGNAFGLFREDRVGLSSAGDCDGQRRYVVLDWFARRLRQTNPLSGQVGGEWRRCAVHRRPRGLNGAEGVVQLKDQLCGFACRRGAVGRTSRIKSEVRSGGKDSGPSARRGRPPFWIETRRRSPHAISAAT